MWTAVVLAGVGCYLLKLAGLSLPERVLAHPTVERVADLIPVALLSALVAVQVFSTGPELVLDARALGLAFAVKNSNRDSCVSNLQMLYGAQEIYSREARVLGTTLINVTNLAPFLPSGRIPKCPLGGTYSVDYITNNPQCTISGHSI